jgi:hypothetical protein
MGDMGLRLAAAHGPGVYLASIGATVELVKEVRMMRGVEELQASVERALWDLSCQLREPFPREEVLAMTRRQLSGLVDSTASSRLLEATTALRDRARLQCVGREGAGDWLTAIPSKALSLRLRKTEILTAAKYRIGLPISCGYGGKRISRHQHLRDTIYQAAVQAGLGPVCEADGLLPDSDDQPADILLRHWEQGRDAAIDVTVVNLLQDALVARVARDGASGVAHAHQVKLTKYWARCQAQGMAFHPMAVDTFGGWHKESLATLTNMGRQLFRALGKPEGEVVRHLRQSGGVLLVRDNVAMLAIRAPPPSPLRRWMERWSEEVKTLLFVFALLFEFAFVCYDQHFVTMSPPLYL